MGTELRRLKPETITRALLALRAELIREGGPGLEHVEALLALRGNNLPPVPRKAVTPARFRRNRLRVAIYAALRTGPLVGPEIVGRVSVAHGLTYGAMYRSVYAQLGRMKKAGRVAHEGRLWALTTPALRAFAVDPGGRDCVLGAVGGPYGANVQMWWVGWRGDPKLAP